MASIRARSSSKPSSAGNNRSVKRNKRPIRTSLGDTLTWLARALRTSGSASSPLASTAVEVCVKPSNATNSDSASSAFFVAASEPATRSGRVGSTGSFSVRRGTSSCSFTCTVTSGWSGAIDSVPCSTPASFSLVSLDSETTVSGTIATGSSKPVSMASSIASCASSRGEAGWRTVLSICSGTGTKVGRSFGGRHRARAYASSSTSRPAKWAV